MVAKMPRVKTPSTSRNPDSDDELSYDELYEKVDKRPLHQEREFPLKPDNHPFVLRMIASDLTSLIAPKQGGNFQFVHHFYTYSKVQNGLYIDFRGAGQNALLTSRVIRTHYDLQPCITDNFNRLMLEYPLEEVIQTLCKPNTSWTRPRSGELYIKRDDLKVEIKPYLHFVCANIIPTRHLQFIPKRQALCMYLLVQGIDFDIPNLILSGLTEAVFTAKFTKALIFPHLISDLFVKANIPQLESDPYFDPSPPFKYQRVKPTIAAPPPPAPIPDIAAQNPAGIQPQPVQEQQADPNAVTLASLSADFQQFRLTILQQFERDRRYRRRMDALIAEHLRFPLPPEDEDPFGEGTSGVGPATEEAEVDDEDVDAAMEP